MFYNFVFFLDLIFKHLNLQKYNAKEQDIILDSKKQLDCELEIFIAW